MFVLVDRVQSFDLEEHPDCVEKIYSWIAHLRMFVQGDDIGVLFLIFITSVEAWSKNVQTVKKKKNVF